MKKFSIVVLVLVLGMILAACSAESVSQEEFNQVVEMNSDLMDRIQVLEDTESVRQVANNLFIQTDNMDWNALTSDVFTENVYFDMTSVGGEAGEVTAQSIVDGWDAGFASIESVQHQSGNMQIQVNGNEATVFQYGTATQYATAPSGKNTRTFLGSYDIGLIKIDNTWKVNAFKFNLKMLDGNLSFE